MITLSCCFPLCLFSGMTTLQLFDISTQRKTNSSSRVNPCIKYQGSRQLYSGHMELGKVQDLTNGNILGTKQNMSWWVNQKKVSQRSSSQEGSPGPSNHCIGVKVAVATAIHASCFTTMSLCLDSYVSACQVTACQHTTAPGHVLTAPFRLFV